MKYSGTLVLFIFLILITSCDPLKFKMDTGNLEKLDNDTTSTIVASSGSESSSSPSSPTITTFTRISECDNAKTGTDFHSGNGILNDPYIICTATELDEVRNYTSAHFQVGADIDLNGFSFDPIPDPFTGVFDGNHYKISNYTYSAPTENRVGFFRSLQNATVRNVNLQKVSITGQSSTGGLVGALIYDAGGENSISNIWVDGYVQGTQRVGGVIGNHGHGTANKIFFTGTLYCNWNLWALCGGLVGGSWGNASYNQQVSQGASYGVIQTQAGANYVSGGIGEIRHGTEVEEIATTMLLTPVNGNTSSRSGGLFGHFLEGGALRNSRTNSAIGTGTYNFWSWSGALGGYLQGNNSYTFDLENNYSTGRVVGQGGQAWARSLGYKLGAASENISEIVYHDDVNQAGNSGVYTGGGSGTGFTGLDENAMKTAANFSTWDGLVWDVQDGRYPKLAWETEGTCDEYQAPFGGGYGTLYDPYTICTVAQLNEVRNYSDRAFRLMADIDLNGESFTPISSFSGVFQGNHFSISNWTYSGTTNFAFFGNLTSGAVIEDFYLTNFNLTGDEAFAPLAYEVTLNEANTLHNINLTGEMNVNGTGSPTNWAACGFACIVSSVNFVQYIQTDIDIYSEKTTVAGVIGSLPTDISIDRATTTVDVFDSNLSGTHGEIITQSGTMYDWSNSFTLNP